MMKYKGYASKIEFDDEDDVFRGQVIGVRDFIIFEGRSVDEVRNSFHNAVDDYLQFCVDRGEKPDKPYSGKFLQRISPNLHRRMDNQAKKEGKSFNSWVEQALLRAIQEAEAQSGDLVDGAGKVSRRPMSNGSKASKRSKRARMPT